MFHTHPFFQCVVEVCARSCMILDFGRSYAILGILRLMLPLGLKGSHTSLIHH
jgi:hypothetical protein